MWLRAQTANENLKPDTQTAQGANDMQAISMIHMIQLEDISQKQFVSRERVGGSEAQVSQVSAEAPTTRDVTF